MGMFEKLQLSDTTVANIEWEITPDLAFCTFSAKGLRGGLANTSERVCYFFIDNWGDEPKLYLMERGVRYVNILAEIKAPPSMMTDCIKTHGGTLSSRNNYPIDSALKDWLIAKVVEPEESPFLIPAIVEKAEDEDLGKGLPPVGETTFINDTVVLPSGDCALQDDQVGQLITQWNFCDRKLNPQGRFVNALADTGDGLTVVDERTGLMWQCAGLDLCSIRSMKRKIEELNKEGFAGYHDWRMPTIEEALSLMERTPNAKGIHLHPCFSQEQPFIFVAARRKPTGYWFVDYKLGNVYWSSGTVPGGFGRLCRRVSE